MAAFLISMAVMVALIMTGVPVAFSMIAVSTIGIALLVGTAGAASQVGSLAVETMFNYTFSVAAMFILMGNLIARTRLSEELFAAAYAFVGHRRGGLAIATVLACGGFSTVTGSSIATVATMGAVAYPEMRRRRYKVGLATGTIAAGGTLGILIPPSIAMIIYATVTELDVARLFAAGILPGLVALSLYALTVVVLVRWDPAAGPPGERTGWRDRLRSLRGVWAIMLLFVLVIGGMIAGAFTATESAGIGAAGALAIAVSRRTASFKELVGVAIRSVETTAALMMIVLGAALLTSFAALAGFPETLEGFVNSLQVPPIVIILVIILIYILLGTVMDAFAMIVLTVPVLAPIVTGLGYDLIWFGIIVVCVTEIAVITPPLGMNVFVLRAMLKDVSDVTIFRGVFPFVLADVVRVAILVLFPWISLVLPSMM